MIASDVIANRFNVIIVFNNYNNRCMVCGKLCHSFGL